MEKDGLSFYPTPKRGEYVPPGQDNVSLVQNLNSNKKETNQEIKQQQIIEKKMKIEQEIKRK